MSTVVTDVLADWSSIRSEELNQPLHHDFTKSYAIVPFSRRGREFDFFHDVRTLPLAEQEKRLRTAINDILHGWNSADIHFRQEGERIQIEANISFDPKVRSQFENCRRALIFLNYIYRNSLEVFSTADGPSFACILATEIHTFLQHNVKILARKMLNLSDLVYALVQLTDVLAVCAELAKQLQKPNVTSKNLIEVVEIHLKTAISKQIVDLLEGILFKMRKQWTTFALTWVKHGELATDPYLEFMIWDFAKLRQSNVALMKNVKIQGGKKYVIVDDRFVGIKDLCPPEFQADFQLIISAGKYVRLISQARLKTAECNDHTSLDDNTLKSSTLTVRALRKLCLAKSEQLLNHIHQKFNLRATYELINAIFLGTDFDLSSLLVKVCQDSLYHSIESVSIRQLQNRMNRIFEHFGDPSRVIKDMRLEFAATSFFEIMGIPGATKNGIVVTSLQLVWQPNTLLRMIWTVEVVHQLTLIQRYMFVLTALLYRVEDRILDLQQKNRARLVRLPRNKSNIHQYNLSLMHHLLLEVITWTRGIIATEAAVCEELLTKASSVEDMCDLLMNQLIAPIFKRIHLCDTETIRSVYQACLAIHNYLEEDEDLQILQEAFDAFAMARDEICNHIDSFDNL